MHIVDHENRDNWKAARRSFIGASESAAILGHGYKDQNLLSVFADKVADPTEERDDRETKAMRIGKLIEPGLIEIFRDETGINATLEAPFRVRHHAKLPYVAATLDAHYTNGAGELVPVELKNVNQRLLEQWDDGEVPLKFQIQIQHQMAVTGASEGWAFGLVGGSEPRACLLQRNDAFIEALLGKLEEFWGWVQRKIVPPDFEDWASEGTTKALRKLHPNDSGETVMLPEECDILFDRYRYAAEKEKEYKIQKEGWRNQLAAALAGNTYGLLPSGREVSHKWQTVRQHVVREKSYPVLRTKE